MRSLILLGLLVALFLVSTRAVLESCDEEVCIEPDLCYYSVGNDTVGCIPPCSYNCTGNPCVEDVCQCAEGSAGNFCEYAPCYDYCDYKHTTSCTGNTGCVCDDGYSLPNCGVEEGSDLVTVYYYAKNLYWVDTPTPVPTWCNNTVVFGGDGEEVVIDCNQAGRVIGLDFTSGSYAFPDTFGSLTALTTLAFTSSKLSFIDENMATLPEGLLELTFTSIQVPTNGFTNLTGEWGNVTNTLESLIFVCDVNSQGVLSPAFGSELTALKTLTIRGMGLQGTIPGNIFHLANLENLDLRNNEFTTVSAPTVAHRETLLTSMRLSDNLISMPFATLMTYLPDEGCETIVLTNNRFSGPIIIPEGFLTIDQFDVENNHLNGTLPETSFMKETGILTLGPENNNFSCPITDYSSWADTTDFESRFTNCTNSVLCLHGSNFTTNAQYFCACTAGWYGPYCAFENFQQLLFYNMYNTRYTPTQSICSQSGIICNSQKLLTTFSNPTLRVNSDHDISFLTSLTTLEVDRMEQNKLNMLPASLVTLYANRVDGLEGNSRTPSQYARTTLPNLKNLTVAAAFITSIRLMEITNLPKLETFTYHYGSETTTGFTRKLFTHPTLKTLSIKNAAFTSIEPSHGIINTALTSIEMTQSSFVSSLYLSFDMLCDNIMPELPNLQTLTIPGLLVNSVNGYFPASCSSIMPSKKLDVRSCGIAGTIPTMLSTAGLSTLYLASNNFYYPITNYSTWAATNDYTIFSDAVKDVCATANCTEPDVCNLQEECAALSKYAGPGCINDGNVVGSFGNYSCNCTTGFYGPLCGFELENVANFYNWATEKGNYYVNPKVDPCTTFMTCIDGDITAASIVDMYGDIFTKEDFNTSALSSLTLTRPYVTNMDDFMTGYFESLGTLSMTALTLPTPSFPTTFNLSQAGDIEITYQSYASFMVYPLVGYVPTFNLSCSIMENLNTLTLGKNNFTIQDCSEKNGTQVLKSLTLNYPATNVTTDRLMASLLDDLDYFEFSNMPGSFNFGKVTENVIYNPSGSSPSGTILSTSFKSEIQYTIINLDTEDVLCPVFDFSEIADTSNYDDFAYEGQDSACVYCRALDGACEEGYYCDTSVPECVLATGFCDFPQCVNGGTCVNDTCHCLGAYSGTYCQIGPFCGCLNGGTCQDNGNCHCSIFFSGPKCATPVINPCGCENDGTCLENGTCVCPAGFSGNKCQINNNCDCENGGTCTESGICVCQPGFTGSKCQNQEALSGGATAGIVVGCVVGVAVIGVLGAAASGAFSGGGAASAGSSYIPMR